MLSILHADVRSYVEELARRFSSAQPFRHVVIDPFLDAAFCEELVAQFPPFEAGDTRNERGEPAGKSVIADIARLGPAYERFDRLMRDGEFLSMIGRITGVPDLIYDEDYVGGGTHENRDGQELDSHVDFNFHPRLGWHRRLNLIVFLNPQWEEAWGGCLELLREPAANGGDARTVVVPLANRAVIFETTESSWHGFPIIRTPPGRGISRKSLAVYFYSHERPAAEIAPSHGTYYYQRPLPGHIQAGYTMREEDVAEIRKLFARRDDHIRFLYERDQEFTVLMEHINKWRAFRLARAMTWPARALKRAMGR
ncbi:MAG TPA: 2OG-Fe(II) oxygenase [Bryobacteraceae bacterium]|nr:2OG-Fe(II) oxygenase [Bryobacteraceae bacterium]